MVSSAPRRVRVSAIEILLGLMLVTVFVIGAALLAFAKVPNVAGLSEDQARSSLEEAGFHMRIVVGAAPSWSTIDEATRVRAVGGAGHLRLRGSGVLVELPPPPARILVPNVYGMIIDDAVVALSKAGFRVVARHVGSNRPVFPSGDTVFTVSQVPTSGTLATYGSVISLRGQAAHESSMTSEAASTLLQAHGALFLRYGNRIGACVPCHGGGAAQDCGASVCHKQRSFRSIAGYDEPQGRP